MKRAVLTAVFFWGIVALSGCPIYSHDDEGCFHDRDCAAGYACDTNSGDCNLLGTGAGRGCTRPDQCAASQTCNRGGQCIAGDCSFEGCVAGYACESSSGIWACVSSSSGSGGDANAGSAGAAGMSVGEAGSGGESAGQAGTR